MALMKHPNGNITDVPESKVERNLSRGFTVVDAENAQPKRIVRTSSNRTRPGPEQAPQEADDTNEEIL
jgi:hypothetical protein